VLALFFAPEHDSAYGLVPSPLPLTLPHDLALVLVWTCWAGLLLSLFAGAAALRARYKAGDPQLRRQVLWLAYGALLLPLWLGGGSLVSQLIGWNDAIDGIGLVILQVWPAVAVAVAVTRHGLYAIDRLVNRTLVYAALTALLVATYALVALGAGLMFGGSAASASIATLAAALAFRPLRDRLQRLVDRRLAPARFEAARLLREFLEDVRDGRAEPEDVAAVAAVALGDPSAEVFFRLPETGAYADRHGRIADPLPDAGRARSDRSRRSRGRPAPALAGTRPRARRAARRARGRGGAGRARAAARRAAPAACRGRVLARADRPGRLRGAPPDRARPRPSRSS
jgi:hypothetical protein